MLQARLTLVPGSQDDGVTATGPVDASGNFAVPLTVPDAGVYRGTADFTPQGGGGLTASASAGLTVLGLTPTVTLSVTPNPAIVGTNVLVSGTVTGPNSIIGTGTVAIKVSFRHVLLVCLLWPAHLPAVGCPGLPTMGCLRE